MSSPVQALAISPLRQHTQTPRSTKRHISLTTEQSPCKRSLVLCSPSLELPTSPGALLPLSQFHVPNKQRFPRDVAAIEASTTKGSSSNDTKVSPRAETSTPVNHIVLPFDLRDPKVDALSSDVATLLRVVFPGITEIMDGGHFLHFSVEELPPQPWPLTVGGLPITIADKHGAGRVFLLPTCIFGNLRISICDNYNARTEKLTDASFRQLAKEVHDAFSKNLPSVRIIEIILQGSSFFIIVLGDETILKKDSDAVKLPGKIARCVTKYINDADLHRPHWAERKAKRVLIPQPAVGRTDNTAYDVLRPGVMVHSLALRDHGHPRTCSTTAGVFVKNPAGDLFMTGASHGIGPAGTVFQVLPDSSRRHIGTAVQEISFTDIAVIQVDADCPCVNEPFEDSANVTPILKRLYGEDNADVTRDYDVVHLDSPFTGDLEGSIVAQSLKLEYSPTMHPGEAVLEFIAYKWVYMGQLEGREGQDAPPFTVPEGTCGAAIWNDEGVVLGFFHYLITEGPMKGFSVSVDSSELVRSGYSLA